MKILSRLGIVTAKDENYIRICYLFNPYEEIYYKDEKGGASATGILKDNHLVYRVFFQKGQGLGRFSYDPLWNKGNDKKIDSILDNVRSSYSSWKKGYIKIPCPRSNSSRGQIVPGDTHYPENIYVGVALLKLDKKSEYGRGIIESLERKDSSTKNFYQPRSKKIQDLVEDYILKGKNPKFDETDLNKVVKDWQDNYSYVPYR